MRPLISRFRRALRYAALGFAWRTAWRKAGEWR
jgi:hypothetical protein